VRAPRSEAPSIDPLPSLFIANRGLPLDRTVLWHLIKKKYAKAAKVDTAKVKFHSLKHSIATHLLDAGADLSFVKDWLGYANIQHTTIYAQITTSFRQDVCEVRAPSHDCPGCVAAVG